MSYAILWRAFTVVFACCYGWWTYAAGSMEQAVRRVRKNAIAIYVFSGVLARCMGLKLFGDVSTKQIVYNNFFLAIASPVNAALLYALANVAVMYVIAWVMCRRGWFVKF